ncbi:MAG: discoidin domain-containing protein [Candidatus Bathyarchaeia archaeon]
MKKLLTYWQTFITKIRNCQKIRILLDFCIITAIGTIIFRNFLFTDKWPAGGDALGIVSRTYLLGSDFKWLYVWRPQSFGFVEVIHGYDFFLMILYWILNDSIATAKIFLFLTFIVSGFSSYTLTYWYTKNSLASLAASFVYILNPWLFSQYTEAHGDILFSYSLAPIVFLLIFRAFETKSLKNIFLAGLALGILVSAFHPECVVIYGSTFPIFTAIYVLMPTKGNTRLAQLKSLLKVALPLLIICLSLAAFVLIPIILNVKPRYYLPTYRYYVEETYGGVYRNLTDAFTLQAVEVWGYVKVVDVVTSVSLQDFPVKNLSLTIFAIAYATVLFKKDKYSIFFLASALFTMFVAKGPYPPFGDLYLWVWFNLPHFAVFRAASRWIMMACLSHAFFMATLVDILTKYIKEKKFRLLNHSFAQFSTKITKYLGKGGSELPIKVTRNFFVYLHKFLYYASIVLIIAIFLNGFLSVWYFFQEGLQVYSLPQNYVEPYQWISSQNGDFKVVSVNRDCARWMGYSYGFDFAFSAMLTEIGWAHDIGYESSFIHNKPVMQDGGWDVNTRNFVDYLRSRLVGQQKTLDFLKLIGTFNYKYIVLPAYLDDDVKEFFLQQEGALENVIYDKDEAIIIENPYYVPRFFGFYESVNILSGFKSFQSLFNLNTFNLNGTVLLFLDEPNYKCLDELQGNSKALIFVNANLLDLAMLRLQDKAKIINAADFGVCSYNTNKYWIQTSSWRDVGAFVFGGKTLTTYGNNSLDIPFEVPEKGIYEIWVRIGFLSNRGTLLVFVDSNFVGEIKPEADYWCGLLWIKLNTLELNQGAHIIRLSNEGNGFNDVDAIAIVQPSLFQSTYNELLESIEDFQGRIIDIIGAANLFAYNGLPDGWAIHIQKYEDDLLKAENTLMPIEESAQASASSIQDEHIPQNAVDGLAGTRWASNPTQETPQWLQIEYASVQEVAGVKILFENAYASNYIIQTWDGSQWITQVEVKNNTSLLPVHMFKEPVKTNKLLLNVTAYGTLHHLVSVFEFQPCKLSSAKANHFIPRRDSYMIALRLASGQDYGILNLKIGNYSFQFNCSSDEEKLRWYEVGPVELEKGETEVLASAYGKIIFDQIILYTVKENEEGISLQSLFSSENSPPTISYEKLNPTTYKLHVKTEQPFFLLFSEAYNPLWKAKIDGASQTVQSIIAYSLINCFYINKTGEFEVEVYFEGQTCADIGLKISFLSLSFVVAVVLIPQRYLKRLKGWLIEGGGNCNGS